MQSAVCQTPSGGIEFVGTATYTIYKKKINVGQSLIFNIFKMRQYLHHKHMLTAMLVAINVCR